LLAFGAILEAGLGGRAGKTGHHLADVVARGEELLLDLLAALAAVAAASPGGGRARSRAAGAALAAGFVAVAAAADGAAGDAGLRGAQRVNVPGGFTPARGRAA